MNAIPRSSISPQSFVTRILAVSGGLLLFAYFLSSDFHLHLGLVLFLLGVLSMVMGNLLNLPARRYERQCGIKHFSLFQMPTPEEYIAGNRFTTPHAVSFYCFENVLLLAGISILVIGLILLF